MGNNCCIGGGNPAAAVRQELHEMGSSPSQQPHSPTPARSRQSDERLAALSSAPRRSQAPADAVDTPARSAAPRGRIPTQSVPPAQARLLYEQHRFFHGTTTAAGASIQQHGFDFGRKTVLGTLPELKTSHYLTQDLQAAKQFARIKVDSEEFLAMNPDLLGVPSQLESEQVGGDEQRTEPPQPKLVRVLLDQNRVGRLERDGAKQIRSVEDIPAHHVLGEKGAVAGGQVFREILADAGYEVDQSEAEAILNEVQSDQEGDFNQ